MTPKSTRVKKINVKIGDQWFPVPPQEWSRLTNIANISEVLIEETMTKKEAEKLYPEYFSLPKPLPNKKK